MAYNKNNIHTINLGEKKFNDERNVYYGEVVSIDDPTDGGRIKVKILGLDNQILDNNDLPYCSPLLPKFLHIFPQVGEMVRIIIQDPKYPQRNRFWVGSIISQLQNIGFDSIYTAMSTSDVGYVEPQKAISSYPDAKGVFPEKKDIGIIGRVNTDIILKENRVLLRAGKHEVDNVYKLNKKNPSTIQLNFEQKPNVDNEYYSNNIILADKIALVSHDGIPKFKAANIEAKDRETIFNESHPMVRGDMLVKVLNIFRNAIINHIHSYSNMPSEKTNLIKDLESINFEELVQKNIVIN